MFHTVKGAVRCKGGVRWGYDIGPCVILIAACTGLIMCSVV